MKTVLISTSYINEEKLDKSKNIIFLAKEEQQKLFASHRRIKLFPYHYHNHLSEVRTQEMLLLYGGKQYLFIHSLQPLS